MILGNADEWYTTENCPNLDDEFDEDLDFTLNINASNIIINSNDHAVIENPYYGMEIGGNKSDFSFGENQLSLCMMVDSDDINVSKPSQQKL